MRRTIAFLIDSLANDYHEGLQSAAERLTRERGFDLLTVLGRYLGHSSKSESAQNFVYDLVGSGRVAGVLAASSIGNFVTPAEFARHCQRYRPVPVAAIGVALPGVPSVVPNNRGGVRDVVEHLITVHGCRRIAFIGGPSTSEEAQQRLAGFLDAHTAAGLPVNPALVAVGDFLHPTGRAAMVYFLTRGPLPDAVVAANDFMAIGALELLRERGIRVPQETRVTGFDDFPAASFASPSLTTVRQPLAEQLEAALDLVLRQIEGEEVPMLTEVDVGIVTRQSCGCAFNIKKSEPSTPSCPTPTLPAMALTKHRGELVEALAAGVRIPENALGGWANRLIGSLIEEVDGHGGCFMAELESLVNEGRLESHSLDEFLMALWVLRKEVRALLGVLVSMEDIWYAAALLIGTAQARQQGRARLDLQYVAEQVSHGLERISTALSHEALRDTLSAFLPHAGITDASIALFPDLQEGPELAHLFAVRGGRPAHVSAATFPATELGPASMFAGETRTSYLVMPLTFAERRLGVAMFSSGVLWQVYIMLRDQVGGALVGGSLHRAVIRETQARERVEREETEREVRIAQAIQTALVPRAPSAPGYEVAGRLVPAQDVGGDYFDVLSPAGPAHPAGKGACWIGIGDVTGHGLMAGVIMMMMRSMVAALLEEEHDAKPSHVLRRLNGAFFDSVQHRLCRDDYATLCLLRFDPDGRVTYAGAHEDILVYRARTRRAQRLATNGVWVGVVADASNLMLDETFVLEPEDVVVLHTDGLTEAMGSNKERFEMERVIDIVECRHGAPVEEIRDALIDAVASYSPLQRDDITVVVIRYQPPRASLPGA